MLLDLRLSRSIFLRKHLAGASAPYQHWLLQVGLLGTVGLRWTISQRCCRPFLFFWTSASDHKRIVLCFGCDDSTSLRKEITHVILVFLWFTSRSTLIGDYFAVHRRSRGCRMSIVADCDRNIFVAAGAWWFLRLLRFAALSNRWGSIVCLAGAQVGARALGWLAGSCNLTCWQFAFLFNAERRNKVILRNWVKVIFA